MQVDKIIVKTHESNYPIIIGNGAISLLKKQVEKLCPQTKKVAIIYDKNVPSFFKIKIKNSLSKYKIFIKDYYSNEDLKSFTN